MNHDTFVHRNVQASLLRYQYARKTLKKKAAELRPLRRANGIPLWRDLETQFVHTALNRRREYFEALRIRDRVIRIEQHKAQFDDLVRHQHGGDIITYVGWAFWVVVAIIVFCLLGECL